MNTNNPPGDPPPVKAPILHRDFSQFHVKVNVDEVTASKIFDMSLKAYSSKPKNPNDVVWNEYVMRALNEKLVLLRLQPWNMVPVGPYPYIKAPFNPGPKEIAVFFMNKAHSAYIVAVADKQNTRLDKFVLDALHEWSTVPNGLMPHY